MATFHTAMHSYVSSRKKFGTCHATAYYAWMKFNVDIDVVILACALCQPVMAFLM